MHFNICMYLSLDKSDIGKVHRVFTITDINASEAAVNSTADLFLQENPSEVKNNHRRYLEVIVQNNVMSEYKHLLYFILNKYIKI